MTKKPAEPEYLLRIFPHYDEHGKKETTAFVLETTKEFVSFNYEILLQDSLQEKSLEFRILGLSAPTTLMPGAGPARARREFEPLSGTYTVRVYKLDGEVNTFVFDFGKNHIVVKERPEHPFVIVRIDPLEITR